MIRNTLKYRIAASLRDFSMLMAILFVVMMLAEPLIAGTNQYAIHWWWMWYVVGAGTVCVICSNILKKYNHEY